MIEITPAGKSDLEKIKGILDKLSLGYPSQGNKSFWIAKEKNKIVGIVHGRRSWTSRSQKIKTFISPHKT